MSGPGKLFYIGNQDFASPYGAVGSISGSIKREADDGAVDPVFRHGADNMSMVVLYLDLFNIFLFLSISRAQIVRVKVKSNNFRLDIQYQLHVPDRQLKKIISCRIFKIADMLA